MSHRIKYSGHVIITPASHAANEKYSSRVSHSTPLSFDSIKCSQGSKRASIISLDNTRLALSRVYQYCRRLWAGPRLRKFFAKIRRASMAFSFGNARASLFGNNSAVSPNALAQTAPDLEEIQTEVSSCAK